MSKPKNPLPANAKMVFKGILFEVWQWEQKMYDGSVKTFEEVKRPSTANVITAVGNEILIGIQEQPNHTGSFPSLPGGRIGEGENPLEAARRELLEESGYESEDWTLWNEQNPVSKMQWTIYTFIARNCSKKQEQKLDSGERITTKLISFEDFLMLSEDPYFSEKELGEMLLRARFDPKFKEEFRELIFGKGA